MLFRSREDHRMLIISLAIHRLMRYRPARPKLVLNSFEVKKKTVDTSRDTTVFTI